MSVQFIDKCEQLYRRNAVLEEALDKIHAWLVCAPIASNDDMAQSFGEMERVAREALGVSE
jgi:hypothetical protein